MPLSKQQQEPMEKLYKDIKKTGLSLTFDHSRYIGKRYRRQDEIGTPLCFTYDFDTPNDQKVTVRHRDTMQQERIPLDAVENYIRTILT